MRSTRLRSLLALAGLLLLATLSPGRAIAQSEICGDFDASGSLVASDALLLLRKAVGQDVLVRCPGCVADVDGCGDLDDSGGVVASDALRLLRKAVGQPVSIDCPVCLETTTTTMGCSPLGGICESAEDCCEVPPPPFPLPGSSSLRGVLVQPSCCAGQCYSSGICFGPESPCECDVQCCSASCGKQTAGLCD